MTDKQMIIDGVDVSRCEKQGETIAGITCGNGERIRLANEIITKHKLCKDNPNCVYKQLKAKEQECEELKEKVKKYGEINEQETKDYAELKAENEELKKIINEAKNSNLDLKSFLVGEAVGNEYEQQLDQLKAENKSLKESLKIFSSTLDWVLKSQVGLYKRQIDSSVPDDWEYEEVLVLVEQYIEKLKQTLAEIKEIIKQGVKIHDDIIVSKQILQKISEVENDNK